MAVQTQIQVRRGTAASWTSTNPTLAAGEVGFETDTGKFKIGNGSSTWNGLTYTANGGIPQSIIDAKGDLVAGTGADAVDRLPVGTTGQILSADSTTTTGLKWVSPGISPAAVLKIPAGSPATTTSPSIAFASGVYSVGVNSNITASANSVSFTANQPENMTAGSYPVTFTNGNAVWTSRFISYYTTSISAVTYGAGKYLAALNTTGPVSSSTDGITWTTSAASPFGTSGYIVAFGTASGLTQKFVALGRFVSGASSLTALASSTDGITWVTRAQPFGTSARSTNENTVASNGSSYIAISSTAATTAAIGYSTDGITWTTVGNSVSGGVGSVVYINGQYLALGTNSAAASSFQFSTNGTTWTTRAKPDSIPADQRMRTAYGNSVYVFFAGDSYTSTDLVTFTARSMPSLGTSNITGILTFDNGLFIMGNASRSSNYQGFYTSTNGITWTRRYLGSTTDPGNVSSYATQIAFGASRWVIAGAQNQGGSGQIYTSESGTGESQQDYYATILGYGTTTGTTA